MGFGFHCHSNMLPTGPVLVRSRHTHNTHTYTHIHTDDKIGIAHRKVIVRFVLFEPVDLLQCISDAWRHLEGAAGIKQWIARMSNIARYRTLLFGCIQWRHSDAATAASGYVVYLDNGLSGDFVLLSSCLLAIRSRRETTLRDCNCTLQYAKHTNARDGSRGKGHGERKRKKGRKSGQTYRTDGYCPLLYPLATFGFRTTLFQYRQTATPCISDGNEASYPTASDIGGSSIRDAAAWQRHIVQRHPSSPRILMYIRGRRQAPMLP